MRPFKPTFIFEVLPQILPYTLVTLGIMLGTVFFGGLLGLLLAAGKLKGGRILRGLASAYTYFIRCVPSIVMLFIIYYGLPELFLSFGININNASKAVFVITTFTFMFGASMSEVFRSAYLAIDPGQSEAGLSIGLSRWQTFRRIILPQASAVALPNFTNALVNLMKEGTLAYTIGLIDIMGKGQLIIGLNHGSYALETYIAMFVIYWVLTLLIEAVSKRLEKHLLRGLRPHEEAGAKEKSFRFKSLSVKNMPDEEKVDGALIPEGIGFQTSPEKIIPVIQFPIHGTDILHKLKQSNGFFDVSMGKARFAGSKSSETENDQNRFQRTQEDNSWKLN